MVSGRYFFPNAPLLYLKWIPACVVTSVYWMGPEGRTDTRLGDDTDPGSGIVLIGTSLTEGMGEAVGVSVGGVRLQLARKMMAMASRLDVVRGLCMTIEFSLAVSIELGQALAGTRAGACRESHHISIRKAAGPTIKSA